MSNLRPRLGEPLAYADEIFVTGSIFLPLHITELDWQALRDLGVARIDPSDVEAQL